MMYIAEILKKHYTNDLLAMFVEYDDVYTRHRLIVKQAKDIRKKQPPTPIPIGVMAEGIESKLDILRKTQEMMEVLTSSQHITESFHWGIKHILKKYGMGILSEDDQVKLCAGLSAKLKSLPTIQKEKEEN